MSKIYVVGIGPGEHEQMTIKADSVLKDCDTIVGYTVYIDLVEKYYSDKEFLSTPMRKEVERCEMAFTEANKGKNVAMICSGDAGVYGMAGVIYELGEKYPNVEIEVVPGVTAALGGSAILGAPLMHDFSIISLSDILTPWEKIESRLRHAAMSDMVLCLYNPSSKKRHDYLKKACEIMMEFKKEETICGIAKQIYRDGQEHEIMTLKELLAADVDMFTTVFVGNESTKNIDGKMITPRGYIF